MWIEVLAIILGLLWLTLSDSGISGLLVNSQGLFDTVSLLAILLLTVPIFFRKGMWKDFATAVKLQSRKFSCSLAKMKKAQYAVEFMQKQLLFAGAVTGLLGLIHVLDGNLYSGLPAETMALCISVALICPLYAVLLELLILPLEIGVKGRIADYMEEE